VRTLDLSPGDSLLTPIRHYLVPVQRFQLTAIFLNENPTNALKKLENVYIDVLHRLPDAVRETGIWMRMIELGDKSIVRHGLGQSFYRPRQFVEERWDITSKLLSREPKVGSFISTH